MIKQRPAFLSSPDAQAFRAAIAGGRTLADAAQAFAACIAVPAPAPVLADARLATDELRKDAGFQAYLNGAAPRGAQAGGGAVAISPFAATVDAGPANISASRASTDSAFAVAGGDTSVTTRSSPYATGLGVREAVGEHGSVSGMALLGAKAKTLTVGGGVAGTQAGVGLTLVHEDKVSVLGPEVVGADGVTRRLARFQSKAMPVVDLGVSGTAGYLAGGVRLVAARGRATVYEKFVPVAELGPMLARRDRWWGHPVKMLSALGLGRGAHQPGRAELAADLGRVERMLPGESATWQAIRAGVVGISGGSHGVRLSLSLNLAGTMTYRLERLEGGLASLTVRPLKVTSARASLDAHVLVDLSASYLRAGAQQRAWAFDLERGSARLALSQALAGRLPGALLPAAPSTDAAALDLLARLGAERLPLGVVDMAAAFHHDSQVHLSASVFKLPDLLGASSLSTSASYTSSLAGQVVAGQATLTHGRESSRGFELLTLGSVTSTSSVSLVSAVSVEAGGRAVLTPARLETEIVHETANSGVFGRRRVAAKVARDVLRPVSVADARPTPRYTATAKQSLSAPDLVAIGRLSSQEVDDLALQHSLPGQVLYDMRDAVGGALASGDHGDFRAALEVIASHSRHGIRALHLLGGDRSVARIVENKRHDHLLGAFQALETMTLSADKEDDLRRARDGLERLSHQAWLGVRELRGDGMAAMAITRKPVASQKIDVLLALGLQADLLAKAATDALPLDKNWWLWYLAANKEYP